MRTGKFNIGPISVIVFKSTEGPTGMMPQFDPLNRLMGIFEFRYNPEEAKKAKAISGISAEKHGYFFLAWAVAKALLGQADFRFDTFVSKESVLQTFVEEKERREAQNLLRQLVGLEFASSMLLRLPGAPDMDEEFRYLRSLVLQRYPIECEPLVPDRYQRIIGPWGERVDSTVRTMLPFFREKFARQA
ncbi:MAG: hypothetical protein KDD69_06525 [Bdellovibrionales bacterium]|nr:hypothetical protein [Bdellovibrionales bacterium]